MQESCLYVNNSHTFVDLLKSCIRLRELVRGYGIHSDIAHLGLEQDLFVGSTLIDMYVKCASFFDALQVFEKLKARNSVSWNTMMAGYAQLGLSDEVLGCIEDMKLEGVQPDVTTFMCALKACCCSTQVIDKGRVIHSKLMKLGYDKDDLIMSSLVNVYAKNGSMLESQAIFDKLFVKDVISYMAIVAGYAEHGPGEGALKCFYEMQQEGVSPDAAIFVCVLKACGSIGYLNQVRELHLGVVKRGYEIDHYVANTLVDVYAKSQSLVDAKAIFNKQLDQNVISWNALLLSYAEHGPCLEALTCFQQTAGFLSPNAATFCSLLKAVGGLGTIIEGYKIHSLLMQRGFESELCTGNSLIDMYAKCGSVSEAQKVFDMLEDNSIISWTVLMAGYAEQGFVSKALECFEKVQLDLVSTDATSLACALKACSNAGDTEKGKQIHILVTGLGFDTDPVVENSLVDLYSKCSLVAEAQTTFDKLPVKNVASWTTLITSYADHGLGLQGLGIFLRMLSENVVPDAALFASALNACGSVSASSRGQEIHASVIQKGLEHEVVICSSLVDMYAKCSSFSEAQSTFDSIKEQHVASWNALIMGYAEHGCDEEASRCFDSMQSKGIYCEAATYVAILKAFGGLGDAAKGYELHIQVCKKGADIDPSVGNALVHMHAKWGALLEAQKVFDKLLIRCVISWNTLIAGYAEYGLSHEALLCYERMKQDCAQQTVVSFTCCLKACGSAGAIGKGHEIHNKLLKVGWETELHIGSALVDMYSKCGSIQEAHQVFDKVSAADVVAWNAMIKGYGLNHGCKMALKFFADMQEHGAKPNSITFLCLLTTCSHNNLMEKGQEYFKMMIEQYNIIPTVDHFSCMVDLFARSGSLTEADKFLEALPYFPSKHIWIPLLSACKTYTEMDIGHKCFEELLHIDPDCASPYILMSSIYGSNENWHNMDEMEKLQPKYKKD